MSIAISYNKYTIYVIIDNVLKKITTEMSKKLFLLYSLLQGT